MIYGARAACISRRIALFCTCLTNHICNSMIQPCLVRGCIMFFFILFMRTSSSTSQSSLTTHSTPSYLLPHIPLPLHHHPSSRNRAHNQRPRKPPSQFRSPINQPLKRKVRKGHAERAKRDLVHGRIVNVVCAVQADDGAERRPGAEGAGAERCDK